MKKVSLNPLIKKQAQQRAPQVKLQKVSAMEPKPNMEAVSKASASVDKVHIQYYCKYFSLQ